MKRLSCLFKRNCPVRRFRSWFLIGPIFLLCLALIGCGGGSSDNNITVTVNPGEVTMEPGDIRQFSATITGTSNTAITWSVDPEEDGGDISTTGLYYAPLTAGTYYVVATSQADSTRFGKAKVNVAATQINIAYIYYGDNTAASNFKALLEPTYPTDLIIKSDIESTSFTKYSLIIIDRGSSLFSDVQAMAIHNTNLPVIGIGVGGLKYFEKIGLNLNGGNVASGQTNQAIVINAALPIWSFPNVLNVSNGSTLTIFNSETSTAVFYKPYLDTGGIHIAGYNISYDTVAQVGTNLYWAYYNDASAFTETGQKLFINTVAYMTQ